MVAARQRPARGSRPFPAASTRATYSCRGRDSQLLSGFGAPIATRCRDSRRDHAPTTSYPVRGPRPCRRTMPKATKSVMWRCAVRAETPMCLAYSGASRGPDLPNRTIPFLPRRSTRTEPIRGAMSELRLVMQSNSEELEPTSSHKLMQHSNLHRLVAIDG